MRRPQIDCHYKRVYGTTTGGKDNWPVLGNHFIDLLSNFFRARVDVCSHDFHHGYGMSNAIVLLKTAPITVIEKHKNVHFGFPTFCRVNYHLGQSLLIRVGI